MPYYQCPKCSGRDTYEGTELVSGSSGGSAITGPVNDLGFSPVMKTGGKKTIDQVTVVKCKKCDIILGDKDLHLTSEDVAKQKREIKAVKEKIDASFGDLLTGISYAVIIAVFVALIYFAFK